MLSAPNPGFSHFIEKWHLKTKFWVLGILITAEVSLLLGFLSEQSKEVHTCIHTQLHVHLYLFLYLPFSLSLPLYILYIHNYYRKLL